MDGTTSLGNNVLFVSTTNKLDRIPARIKHRPSRIDTLIEVDWPSVEHKVEYAKFIFPEIDCDEGLLNLIQNETNSFSLADIKELIISIVIYELDHESALNKIKKLKLGGND